MNHYQQDCTAVWTAMHNGTRDLPITELLWWLQLTAGCAFSRASASYRRAKQCSRQSGPFQLSGTRDAGWKPKLLTVKFFWPTRTVVCISCVNSCRSFYGALTAFLQLIITSHTCVWQMWHIHKPCHLVTAGDCSWRQLVTAILN